MEKSLWLATAYIQKAEQLDQFVALAAFATTAEEFEQRSRVHFAQKAHFRFQLAPIPAHVFFQRHGRTYLLHQASTLREDEIRVIPLSDEMPQPAIEENIEYLHCHKIDNVEPLDAQFDRMPALFAPENIAQLLWPDFPIPPNQLDFEKRNESAHTRNSASQIDKNMQQRHLEHYTNDSDTSPTLKVYFVLDAKKIPFLNTLPLKGKMKSLFQGKFGEDTEKVAPYLIEVIRDENHIHTGEMMGLFSLKSAQHHFNWEDNLGIFIHSYADFETVYQHLRKFPMLQDERGKWFFFRFYDPKVLHNYLAIIAKHPAKLHKFFGYDNNIIYAFGLGLGNRFYYYTLKTLPEETLPSPIVMTDWEIDGFKTHKWLETKEYLMEYTLQEYPQLYSEENKHELCQNLEEGYKKGYTYEISILQYALAKQSAVKNGIDFIALEEQVTKNNTAPLERAIKLCSLLNIE